MELRGGYHNVNLIGCVNADQFTQIYDMMTLSFTFVTSACTLHDYYVCVSMVYVIQMTDQLTGL